MKGPGVVGVEGDAHGNGINENAEVNLPLGDAALGHLAAQADKMEEGYDFGEAELSLVQSGAHSEEVVHEVCQRNGEDQADPGSELRRVCGAEVGAELKSEVAPEHTIDRSAQGEKKEPCDLWGEAELIEISTEVGLNHVAARGDKAKGDVEGWWAEGFSRGGCIKTRLSVVHCQSDLDDRCPLGGEGCVGRGERTIVSDGDVSEGDGAGAVGSLNDGIEGGEDTVRRNVAAVRDDHRDVLVDHFVYLRLDVCGEGGDHGVVAGYSVLRLDEGTGYRRSPAKNKWLAKGEPVAGLRDYPERVACSTGAYVEGVHLLDIERVRR
jgi:hypothetical protein